MTMLTMMLLMITIFDDDDDDRPELLFFFPHYFPLKVLSHMLPERLLNPCPFAHQSMAGNSIHTWQHQPNNHLLATHVFCPRRNLEVSAVVTPCISWRAISFFLISSVTHSLLPYLSLLLSSQYFIPAGLAVLEGVFLGMKITSPQNF